MFSRIGQQQQQLLAPLASREETETPSMGSANYAVNGSDPTARNSYEDTESEWNRNNSSMMVRKANFMHGTTSNSIENAGFDL